jgi:hypothetical protein
MKNIFVLLIVLATITSVLAQNRPTGGKTTLGDSRSDASASKAARALSASSNQTSPFPVPTTTDTRFVVDEWPGALDTGCTYRSEGSLKFHIGIKRYVGAVTGDGRLANPQALISSGVISRFATLRMPAYDVDFDVRPQPPLYPEQDLIMFNGQRLAYLGPGAFLRGADGKWRMNEIQVPIELVRFGTKGSNGSEPGTGDNEIEILIDQANQTDTWCTSLDWAALSFNALAPVIMIHGNGKSGAFWDVLNFTRPFQQAGIPYDNSISLPTTFVASNAQMLSSEIPRVAREFGAKHVHLVTHSKGGLDSRAFLKLLPSEGQLAVLSLTTLSTPHHGSVLADYVRDAKGASVWSSDESARTFFFQKLAGDYDQGRQNLTTHFVQDVFNPQNLPLPQSFKVDGEVTSVRYCSYGADANLDDSFSILGNPSISSDEMVGTDYSFRGSGYGGELVYRTVYYVASTHWEWAYVGGEKVRIVREVQNQAVQPNDFLVTINSSKLPGHFLALPNQKRNHATIADEGMGNLVVNLIRLIQPLE